MVPLLILMQILGMMTGCCLFKFYKNGWVPQKYFTEGDNPEKQRSQASGTAKSETPSASPIQGRLNLIRKAEALASV